MTPNISSKLWRPYSRTSGDEDYFVARGEGQHLYDGDGRSVIDAISGLFNVPVGYGHREVTSAIARQMETLSAHSLIVGVNDAASSAASSVAAHFDCDRRIFFCSGGAEAVETAIKMARHFFFVQHYPNKAVIATVDGGYHGVTYGALAATGHASCRRGFGKMLPDIEPIASAHDLLGADGGSLFLDAFRDGLERIGVDRVAAVLLEPVCGIGGVIPIAPEVAREIASICRQNDILIIADEITSGLWRCGGFSVGEDIGLEPDIVVLGKGLTNGYAPIGAVAPTQRIHEVCARALEAPFLHGYTYGGNPIACAAVSATLAAIVALKDGLLDLSAAFALSLRELALAPGVARVRQVGLLASIELDEGYFKRYERAASDIRQAAWRSGVTVRPNYLPGGLNIAPMYIATPADLALIAERLGAAIAICTRTNDHELSVPS